jgi:PAS domain S-box-containing protein
MSGTKDSAQERAKPVPICAIGASAGGVAALQRLFGELPTDLGLAYVVILHLAPDQPSALGEVLSHCTEMPVHQVRGDNELRPDCIYVIPPDRELVIEADRIAAKPFTDPHGKRAPIDIFFRSAAKGRGDGIAIVLSGAGSDGAIGVRAVKEAGGVVMAQDPAEAAFPSMPRSTIETGAVDFVAPIARLAEHVTEVARSKEAVRSLDMDQASMELRRIVAFLRARTGHDFSGYKRATIMRRVTRRMQINQCATFEDYGDYLKADPEEAQELLSDLLITVTHFFRDPAAFEALQQRAIRPLFDEFDPDSEESIRAWVVGCATGEEAYSLAILLHEEALRRKIHPQVQIFASDLDQKALATAREGRYLKSIAADVSPERLSRFFIDEGSHYRVRKEIRESVLFASHSVIKEPPFMRLDIVSCRNLMIYLERSLQQQLLAIFHYGLKPGAYLFLGLAETADVAGDLFAQIDHEARLYCARPRTSDSLRLLPQFAVPEMPEGIAAPVAARGGWQGNTSEQHLAALEEHAPPSALVDETQNVLHLSPGAGRFLLHYGGSLSSRLPDLVRPELRLELKLALTMALEKGGSTLTHQTLVAFDGVRRRVAMQIIPVDIGETEGVRGLVFFLDGGLVGDEDAEEEAAPPQPEETRRLQRQLRAAQEALVVSRSNHESTIQDLRAANEELQSINEEYRSTAEELETSKEELQSINEELHAVNAELKSKLESISSAHSDLKNLTASAEIGTLFLDPHLKIRMFTPPVTGLFNISEQDLGRSLSDFRNRLDYDDFEADIRHVLGELESIEREVRSEDGRHYVMRVRPYRTLDDRIDGTVITFIEITARLKAEEALARSEMQFRTLVRASSHVLYRMGRDWEEMRELSGGDFLSDTEQPTASWMEEYVAAEDRELVRTEIREAIENKSVFELEHRVRRADGTIGWTQSRAIPLFDDKGEIVEWFGSANDVTARREAGDILRKSEERLRALIEGIPQLVWRAANGGQFTWTSPQWQRVAGLTDEESRDRGWLAAIHPDDREGVLTAWDEAYPEGLLEVECRVGSANGKNYRWFQWRALPVRNAMGRIVEWLGTATDVDDLRRLQERQRVMVAELQHRTRNLLGVVRSISEETLRASDTLEAFQGAFNSRLAALSRVQGLLSRSDDDPITLGALLQAELEALGATEMLERIVIEGPDVRLRRGTVQTFALALHELATNARKHGALSTDRGLLNVSWREYEGKAGRRLSLSWRETGLPPGSGEKTVEGYGRELIERALPYVLDARTQFDLAADELLCTIDMPLRMGEPEEHDLAPKDRRKEP